MSTTLIKPKLATARLTGLVFLIFLHLRGLLEQPDTQVQLARRALPQPEQLALLEPLVLHLQLLDLPEPREPKVQLVLQALLAQREPQVLQEHKVLQDQQGHRVQQVLQVMPE